MFIYVMQQRNAWQKSWAWSNTHETLLMGELSAWENKIKHKTLVSIEQTQEIVFKIVQNWEKQFNTV